MPIMPASRKLKPRAANQFEVTLVIISERQGKAEEREQEREKREKEGEKKEGQGREEGRKREAHTNWAFGRCKQKDQESKVAFSHSKFKALLS